MPEIAENEYLLREVSGDISSLANYASVDLDKLALNKRTDLKYLKNLVKIIAEKVVEIPEPTSPRSLLDPTKVRILYEAFSETKSRAEIQKVEDIIAETKIIVDMLRNVILEKEKGEAIAVDNITYLKEFCRAISKKAAVFKPSPFEMECQCSYGK